jgi:hypothetical protein
LFVDPEPRCGGSNERELPRLAFVLLGRLPELLVRGLTE